jgi:uncharacterized membrane protein
VQPAESPAQIAGGFNNYFQVQHTSQLRNRIFIPLLIVSNTVGNLFLARGMQQMPDFEAIALPHYMLAFVTNFWILGGIALLVLWMVSQLSMFTWADLSYVLPVTAGAYVLSAMFAKFFLNETISVARWAGIGLIAFGVVLVAETPQGTHRVREGGT